MWSLSTHELTSMNPSWVNLTAFDNKFIHTYYRRYLSTKIVFLGMFIFICIFLLAAYISITLTTSVTAYLTSHLIGLVVNVPLWICAKSRVSFTLFNIRIDENFIISSYFFLVSSFSVLSKSSVKLIQVLNGVRISWETFALYIEVSLSWVSSYWIFYSKVTSLK